MVVISKLIQLASKERLAVATVFVLYKILDQIRGRVAAHILGWPSSYIGIGSKILGTSAITVGKGAYINRYAWVEAVHTFGGQIFSPQILIGSGFAASDRLHISAINRVEIGDNCLFGSGVYVGDHNHGSYKGEQNSSPNEPPVRRKLISFGSVTIGSNVWLGDNVVVIGAVSIGNGVVIGANSVVTKDVPANVIAAGAPLRILKVFNPKNGLWEKQSTHTDSTSRTSIKKT